MLRDAAAAQLCSRQPTSLLRLRSAKLPVIPCDARRWSSRARRRPTRNASTEAMACAPSKQRAGPPRQSSSYIISHTIISDPNSGWTTAGGLRPMPHHGGRAVSLAAPQQDSYRVVPLLRPAQPSQSSKCCKQGRVCKTGADYRALWVPFILSGTPCGHQFWRITCVQYKHIPVLQLRMQVLVTRRWSIRGQSSLQGCHLHRDDTYSRTSLHRRCYPLAPYPAMLSPCLRCVASHLNGADCIWFTMISNGWLSASAKRASR